MSIASALRAYAWNLAYAEALTRDLTEAQWTWDGGPGLENHAAWTIGHLVSGSDILAEDLGLAREMSQEWRELFERRGPGDPRLPSRDARYPDGSELLAEFARQHDRVARRWRDLAPDDGDAPLAWRFEGYLPSLADAALFLAVNHECLHLGSLSGWRRAQGLPSALAAMSRGPATP
ncbi:MAG: DinB family protein [Planctomycetota bacterium]